MNVTFLGVGEAFDERHPNISMLVTTNSQTILLDCGYRVPHALWNHNDDPNLLDAIWISHAHADHCFGLGPLLVRMHEAGRTKPLTILTRADIQTRLDHVIDTAYPGALDNASFDIDWHDVDAHDRLGDVEIKTAPTIHTVPNRAIRLTNKNDVFCYSGDGEVTDETRSLYENADVLVHETYTMEEQLDNHSNIRDIARVRRKHHVHHCAAVHIRRDIRQRDDLAEFAEHRGIIIPDDGDSFTV